MSTELSKRIDAALAAIAPAIQARPAPAERLFWYQANAQPTGLDGKPCIKVTFWRADTNKPIDSQKVPLQPGANIAQAERSLRVNCGAATVDATELAKLIKSLKDAGAVTDPNLALGRIADWGARTENRGALQPWEGY